MDIDKIRQIRRELCFPVINRGKLWYDSLTAEQRAELQVWYQSWLNAPNTGITPQTPSWIFNK